jgi:tetratricopeptide (TPR) repeat protein
VSVGAVIDGQAATAAPLIDAAGTLETRQLARMAARRRLEPLLAADGAGESALPATLAWALLEQGELEHAMQVVEAAVAVARAGRLRLVLVEALPVLARVTLRAGRLEDAAQAAEAGLALARAMPYPYAEAKALYVYGQLHVAKGVPEQAREQLDAALTILNRLGERLYAAHVEQALAALDQSPSLG